MKKVLVVRPGELEFVDLPEPEVGPGDVRISVRLSGLSSRSEIERYVRNPAGKPEEIGYNVVGVIDACGAEVTRVAPGRSRLCGGRACRRGSGRRKQGDQDPR